MFCMGPYAFLGVTKKYLEFKKKYARHPAGEIVYYGASNFTFWDTCEEDMKPYHVQNHGFGGCTDALMLKYADNLLYPYKPSVVFVQTGSNDNASGLTLEEIKQNIVPAINRRSTRNMLGKSELQALENPEMTRLYSFYPLTKQE